jgi:hypothetical protein
MSVAVPAGEDVVAEVLVDQLTQYDEAAGIHSEKSGLMLTDKLAFQDPERVSLTGGVVLVVGCGLAGPLHRLKNALMILMEL